MPTGYSVNALSAQACPSPTAAPTVTLTVGLPNGTTKTMDIAVRTP
jgi:hypothetical protein